MTPQQLQAMRERAEKASASPWGTYTIDGEYGIENTPDVAIVLTAGEISPNNADFIAHARQDIPDLLAYVAELEAALRKIAADGIRGSDTGWEGCTHPGIAQAVLPSTGNTP